MLQTAAAVLATRDDRSLFYQVPLRSRSAFKNKKIKKQVRTRVWLWNKRYKKQQKGRESETKRKGTKGKKIKNK